MTRSSETLENLRERFVRKFEGYRLQTEAEKNAGVYPDNFSTEAVGRGHADQMRYNPFPEPTPPGTRLATAKYAALISALLYDYSVDPIVRPLVEYYKYNLSEGGTANWTVSRILADIGYTLWPCAGNYRQLSDNEIATFLGAILDRLSPLLWKYVSCVPVEYPAFGWEYAPCEATRHSWVGYEYEECAS